MRTRVWMFAASCALAVAGNAAALSPVAPPQVQTDHGPVRGVGGVIGGSSG